MKLFQKKRFGNRFYLTGMCVLVTLIVVLINLCLAKLPLEYTRFDTSVSRLYSVSAQTKEIVSGVTDTVELYLIAPGGKEDARLTRLLDRYAALSSRLRVEYVDPVLSPTFVQGYTSDKVSDNSMIVACGEKFRVIRNSELFPNSYDYDTGSISESFDGEGQITSAIRYVTTEQSSHVYLLSGHGEEALTDSFREGIQKEGIELTELNLVAADAVPEDAACLLIHVPTSDITAGEADRLTGYLEQGGKLLLITGITAVDMPNLNRVTALCGLQMASGLVVEGDANGSIPSYPNFLLPTIHENEITQPFIDEKGLLLLPNAHAIVRTQETRSTLGIQELLTTSSNSWLKTDTSTLQYQQGDLVGPLMVGAVASEQVGDDAMQFAWFSSSMLLMDEIDEMVGGNNVDLVLNTIGWMTQQDDGISIRPKTTSSPGLRLTAAQATVWGGIYIIALPVLVLVLGIIVCVKRRKQQ